MAAAIIRPAQFSGASKVFTLEADGLTAVIRGLAIDNARRNMEAANLGAFTDSSTGTPSTTYTLVDFAIPSVAFDATSAGGVQRAAFNTSIGKISNAYAVMGERINSARARFGLSMIDWATGTVATSGTIAALDLTATTSNGTSAVDYASYRSVMLTMKSNHRKLIRAFIEVLTALDINPLTVRVTGTFSDNYVLASPATIAAATTGASSVALAVGTAALAAIANNIATIAAVWNQIMLGAGLTSLTDNSAGTASTTSTIAAMGTMTPFTTAGTDLAPKAGFDAEVAIYANSVASIAARLNLVSKSFGLGSLLTDNTTGTPGTTLAANSVNLTAVAGAGSTAVPVTTALARWTALKNNIATLVAVTNTLAPRFGVTDIIDTSGGVASTASPRVLVALAATGAGVDGSALSGVADTEVDTNLAVARNAIATLAAKVNGMLGSSADWKPLRVVAG